VLGPLLPFPLGLPCFFLSPSLEVCADSSMPDEMMIGSIGSSSDDSLLGVFFGRIL
jgi:hypothetical protein